MRENYLGLLAAWILFLYCLWCLFLEHQHHRKKKRKQNPGGLHIQVSVKKNVHIIKVGPSKLNGQNAGHAIRCFGIGFKLWLQKHTEIPEHQYEMVVQDFLRGFRQTDIHSNEGPGVL